MPATALRTGLLGLVAVAAGALVCCCFYSLLKSAASCYLALALLASLLGLGLVAVGWLLATLLRRQWYQAFNWLLLVVVSFGSCWGGTALCLYVVGGHLSTAPPPS